MEKLFYSIGEVAEILGENTSAVRFWTNYFERFLKPKRNAKGNRRYTAEEIETLKQIRFLTKEQGLTLEGTQKALSEDRSKVESRVKALETLKEIRAQLEEVRKSL
ncbi:MAG: MerR family transcriptional regulator [Bacteroidales bacterium]|jgi:DNA-binding transcriptional MerR regulator|nr:MerR family transcriptional regulator [Bacteroidales bacterium]MBP5549446.1 MerR family transcriptional regulator [Bacteroidales bacterium]MBQ1748286.1 MerR family transcriptional regulator [Bacteroidales bacterium]MBQ2090876.1 MerR family transcriptional regulator [Bacteroidales bacterium]MBQ7468698.1 MerR family transcriptional regulator [Bacteroidales bacterium]